MDRDKQRDAHPNDGTAKGCSKFRGHNIFGVAATSRGVGMGGTPPSLLDLRRDSKILSYDCVCVFWDDSSRFFVSFGPVETPSE